MEGDERSRNDNNTNVETDRVTGQEVCTTVDTGVVSSVMSSGKSHICPFDSSVDPDLEDCRREEQVSSSELSFKDSSAAVTESGLLTHLENNKERNESEIDAESQKNKGDQHASTSQQESSVQTGSIPSNGWESSHQTETAQGVSANSSPDNSIPQSQSVACAERESYLEFLEEKISVSSDRQCNGSQGTPGTNLQGSDKTEDHFSAVGEVIPTGDECGKISMHQVSRQSKSDSAVTGSLDNMRCKMEENPEEIPSGSLTYDTCSSDIQQHDSNARQSCFDREQPEMEKSSFSDQTNSHKRPVENAEGKTETGYLDGVISSIQSLPYSQTEGDKDTVKISRAELAVMVQQMLTAQTMSSYMQGLEQKNKMLNKQNEVLKDTIVQTRNWRGGKADTEPLKSMPVISRGTESHVFCFPGSLPAVHSQLPNSSMQAPSREHYQPNTDHAEVINTDGLQTDGDLSSSLQLSSQLGLDGDTAPGISAAGLSPHVRALNGAASGPPSQEGFQHNLPTASLLDGAHSYSMGPQLYEDSAVGCAGVSLEQFQRVVDELEKTKRFVNNISNQAGIHPDNMQELVSLREKVRHVQDENAKLKMELQNRPSDLKQPLICAGQEEHARLLAENKDLQQKFQGQKNREDHLHEVIKKLGTQMKTLKPDAARPQSQPPSNVGLQALPPISHTATTPVMITAESQTEDPYPGIQGYAAKMTHLQEALKQCQQSAQLQVAKLTDQLMQAQSSKADYERAVQKLQIELQQQRSASSQLHGAFQLKFQELNQRCEELAQLKSGLELECKKQKKELYMERERIRQLETVCEEAERNGLKSSHEAERNKRKHLQEVDRNGQLEKMLQDERKRYARDEKELLERVKLLTQLTKEMDLLKMLVLTVDQARMDGSPLSKDCVDMVADLRTHFQHKASATSAAGPVRPSRSCSNIPGPPPHPMFQQPRSFSGSSNAGQASAPPPLQGRGAGHVGVKSPPPQQGSALQGRGAGNVGVKAPPQQGNAGVKSPPPQQGSALQGRGAGNADAKSPPGQAGAKAPPQQGSGLQGRGAGNAGANSSGRGHHSPSNPPQ